MLNQPFSQVMRDAEEALLGAILIEGTCVNVLPEIKDLVSTDDFSRDIYQRIYRAMLKCELPHIINVAHQMFTDKTLESKDCAAMRLFIAFCPTSLEYLAYAQAVSAYAKARRGSKSKADFKGGI